MLLRVLLRLGCGLTFWRVVCVPAPFASSTASSTPSAIFPCLRLQEKTEWAFARLMYPPGPLNGYRNRDLDWHVGVSSGPRIFRAPTGICAGHAPSDRTFARRATGHLDEGDAYDWPWLTPSRWRMGPHRPAGPNASRVPAARRILQADDFHGPPSGASSKRASGAFPGAPIVDIPTTTHLPHGLRCHRPYQVPGQAHLRVGYKYADGKGPTGAHLHDKAASWCHLLQLRSRRCVEWATIRGIREVFRPGHPPRCHYVVYAMTH